MTDGLIFVIDSADQRRMEMCKNELHQLLKQEVRSKEKRKSKRKKEHIRSIEKLALAAARIKWLKIVASLCFLFLACLLSFLSYFCCFLSLCQKLSGASLLIFANKQDLPGALSREAIASVLDLSTLGGGESGAGTGTSRHWQIISCSAVTGDGLIEGVDWIVNDIAGRIYMMEQRKSFFRSFNSLFFSIAFFYPSTMKLSILLTHCIIAFIKTFALF